MLMSPQDIAASLGEALGRRVSYMDVSERMFRKAMQANRFSHFDQTQLAQYAQEYREGAFAAGGTTDTVRALTGREPEDLTTIARRYAAERPEAQRSLGNKLKAVGGFLRLVLTRPLDLVRLERERDHALLRNPRRATQSDDWKRTHQGTGSFGVEVGLSDRQNPASTASPRTNHRASVTRASLEVSRA